MTINTSMTIEITDATVLNAIKNAKQINGIPSYNELNHEILVK